MSSARIVDAGFGSAISIMFAAGVVDMSVWVYPRGVSSRCFGVWPRCCFSDPSFFIALPITGDGLISPPSCIFLGLLIKNFSGYVILLSVSRPIGLCERGDGCLTMIPAAYEVGDGL